MFEWHMDLPFGLIICTVPIYNFTYTKLNIYTFIRQNGSMNKERKKKGKRKDYAAGLISSTSLVKYM
jgi:hypothetical protein